VTVFYNKPRISSIFGWYLGETEDGTS